MRDQQQRHTLLSTFLLLASLVPITHTSPATHLPVIIEGSGLPLRVEEDAPHTTFVPVIPEGGGLPFNTPAAYDSLANVTVLENGRAVFPGAWGDVAVERDDTAQGCPPVICGTYELSPCDSFTVSSPNYPAKYPNDFNCRWQFIAVGGSEELTLDCPVFDLENNDFLRVKPSSDPGVEYYETNAPQVTSTEGGSLMMRFVSNPWVQGTGFTCTVAHVDGCECTTTTSTTSTSTTTTTTTTTTPTTTTTTTPTTTTTTTTTATSCWSHPLCGIKRPSRIINGEETVPHEYPWMVWLNMRWADGMRRLCGGTIIHEEWVMTAAHCTFRTNRAQTDVILPKVQVMFGGHILNGGQPVASETVIMHPSYRLSTDIALVKLREPLTFTDKVAPICLPPRHWSTQDFANLNLTLSGWGKTESGSLSSRLRDYDTVGYDFPSCDAFYGDYLEETQMCTDGANERHTCSGDSGGPVMREEEGRVFQAGVISFGATRNCRGTFPDGHVRVAAFLEWILGIIGGSGCP